MITVQRNRTWIIALAVLLALIIIAFVLLFVRLTNQAQENRSLRITQDKQESQLLYQNFEDRLLTIALTADAKYDALLPEWFSFGSIEAFLAAARETEQSYENAARDSRNLRVPTALPDNVEDLLNQAKNNMSSALTNRTDAIDSLGKAIESQDIGEFESQLRNFGNSIDQANESFAEAQDNLTDARSELDLPTTEPFGEFSIQKTPATGNQLEKVKQFKLPNSLKR